MTTMPLATDAATSAADGELPDAEELALQIFDPDKELAVQSSTESWLRRLEQI